MLWKIAARYTEVGSGHRCSLKKGYVASILAKKSTRMPCFLAMYMSATSFWSFAFAKSEPASEITSSSIAVAAPALRREEREANKKTNKNKYLSITFEKSVNPEQTRNIVDHFGTKINAGSSKKCTFRSTCRCSGI